MLIPTSHLPTHLALVARRLNTVGAEQSADTFLLASYLAEVTVKTVGAVLYCGLVPNAPEVAYRYGHAFVRSDGLGEWDQAIRSMTANNIATFLTPDFRPLLAWATKKRNGDIDKAFRQTYAGISSLLDKAGGEYENAAAPTMRDLVTMLVQLRNKTRGHGAWGPDFYQAANPPYIEAVRTLLNDCPAFQWDWLSLVVQAGGKVRGAWTKSEGPIAITESDARQFAGLKAGLHFRTDKLARPHWCGDLIRADQECRHFYLPNGGHTGKEKAEFIDYATPETQSFDVTAFSRPPSPLPPSETVGLDSIDIQSNIFGNLPTLPTGYVERPQLQVELFERLSDNNHPVITLHGRGGIGKTSLALFALHTLASANTPRFEHILWFSARDLDLRPTGPAQVKQAVVDLKTICKQLGRSFAGNDTPDALAATLQNPSRVGSRSILFVFDNFETLDDLVGLHKFLDTHTHLPNKVLITSRERAFKGDFPIEVRGMERAEAQEMLAQVGRQLAIEGILTAKVKDDIFDRTEGHPYVMRVVLGEIAKASDKPVSVKKLIPYRDDVINSVFERSFNKLTPDARWIFLCIANWRSAISEIALTVVLSQRDIDVDAGLDECQRLSLINQDFADGVPHYHSPELARTYARKKLEGDPDKLTIEESLELLRSFGVIAPAKFGMDNQEKQVGRFVDWCFQEADRSNERVDKLDSLLNRLSDFAPVVWLRLAEFRQRYLKHRKDIEYALRRAVEELPTVVHARIARADYAQSVGDETTRIASLVSAVELAPHDIELVCKVAGLLSDYLTKHKYDIPLPRRGVYLSSVRSTMVALAPQLDSKGLSRLAWLFLLENNSTDARVYAIQGLAKDSSNQDCQKIIQRTAS